MNARPETGEAWASRAYRWVLIAGYLTALAANLPGHMSPEAVLAYEQAREKLHATWEPAAYSAVLQVFDRMLRGTSLYVAAASVLLFGSWLALPGVAGRRSWLAVAVAALALLTPQVLIYQGEVWRDVLFADLAVAAFVLIARAERDWPARRDWLSLAAAVAMLALAAAVRENGLVIGLAGALTIAWAARRGGWRALLAWGAGAMVVIALLSAGLDLASRRKDVDPDWQAHTAAAALDLQGRGTQTLADLVLTPDPSCKIAPTGVHGPADLLDSLELAPGKTMKDRALSAYARAFYATPVYSHLTWAIVALAIAVLLLFRRRAADGAMAGLQLGALAFGASLALTAASCHYRNLYVVDLAGMTGLIYLALTPGWPKRRKPG
jgi:hypothetical protein